MAALIDHEKEYKAGIVSEGGFDALMDAEIYGNVSSVSALKSSLCVLLEVLNVNQKIEVCHSKIGTLIITNRQEFIAWCLKYFPSVHF